MLDAVKDWFAWASPYIVDAWPWLRSILMGYAGAVGLTQVGKFWIPGDITDENHKRLTRAMAATIATLLIYFTWPAGADSIVWAVAIGCLCPLVVKGGLLLLYWKFPALETRLSARPHD